MKHNATDLKLEKIKSINKKQESKMRNQSTEFKNSDCDGFFIRTSLQQHWTVEANGLPI